MPSETQGGSSVLVVAGPGPESDLATLARHAGLHTVVVHGGRAARECILDRAVPVVLIPFRPYCEESGGLLAFAREAGTGTAFVTVVDTEEQRARAAAAGCKLAILRPWLGVQRLSLAVRFLHLFPLFQAQMDATIEDFTLEGYTAAMLQLYFRKRALEGGTVRDIARRCGVTEAIALIHLGDAGLLDRNSRIRLRPRVVLYLPVGDRGAPLPWRAVH